MDLNLLALDGNGGGGLIGEGASVGDCNYARCFGRENTDATVATVWTTVVIADAADYACFCRGNGVGDAARSTIAR